MSLRRQPEVRVGDQDTRGTRESRKRTKAGMPRKQKEISIHDRPINVLGKKAVGDSAPRDAGETNPRGLRCAVAIRYKNSGQNKPKPVIFRVVCRLQRKWARFSANLNANDPSPSRIPSLYPSTLPPSFDKTGWRESQERPSTDGPCAPTRGPKVRRSGAGRARHALVPWPSWPSSPCRNSRPCLPGRVRGGRVSRKTTW